MPTVIMSNKIPYFRNLQSKLDDRRRRIMDSACEMFHVELKTFFDFLDSVGITKAIIFELKLIASKEDFSKYSFGSFGLGGRSVSLPSEEKQRIAYYYTTLLSIKDYNTAAKIASSNVFSGGSTSIAAAVDGLKVQIFLPVYDYVFEKISDGDFLLYLLLRFKFNAEFFNKKLFENLYKDSTEEEIFDRELRKYLFGEGLDYPFSKPQTPSGAADIVCHVEQNPIPLEVKIFDPDRSYNKARIIDGIYQAKRYADDYNQPLGYLIVFNPSNKYLEPKNGPFPATFPVGARDIVVIVIDINSTRKTASVEKKPEVIVITLKDIEGNCSSL